MRKKFYVLEGIDGSGKTTVGKYLQKTAHLKFIETPTRDFRRVNKSVPKTQSGRFDYFMRSNKNAINRINKLPSYAPAIIGRYKYSTLIYTAASESFDIPLTELERMAHSYSLPNPAKTFLLTISNESQIERLLKRQQNSQDDLKIISDHSFRDKINSMYRQVAAKYGWTIIDTTQRSVENVAEEIIRNMHLKYLPESAPHRIFYTQALGAGLA